MVPFFRTNASRRALLVVPAMVVALWFVITITASAAFTRYDPALAVRLDRSNSGALEQQATSAVADGTAHGARNAVALATRALIASPMSSEGATTLAAARSLMNPDAKVLPIFNYSRLLMRRNLIAELWFIEDGARTGNIAEALGGYDHVFRVSDYYRGQLMPVLVSASAQPEVASGVGRLLENRPAWRYEYYASLLKHSPGAGNFSTLLQAMQLNPRDLREAPLLSAGMTQLVNAGRPDIAYTIYLRAVGKQKNGEVPRDPGFHRVGILPPFDWELTDTDQMLATVGSNERGQAVLELSNRGGSGTFARQMLMLPPGPYRLTYLVGNVGGADVDRPQMQVSCFAGTGASGAATLFNMVFPVAPVQGRVVEARFTVPERVCRAQWLLIQAGAPVDAVDTLPWVGRLSIRPTDER